MHMQSVMRVAAVVLLVAVGALSASAPDSLQRE
jgi:hypothetical protein